MTRKTCCLLLVACFVLSAAGCTKLNKPELLIIEPKGCLTCNTSLVISFLKAQFKDLRVDYLYYPDGKAANLSRKLDITVLPAYLLSKKIEKEAGFAGIQRNIEARGRFYMLKPQFSGVSYYINREKIKGKLDLFISLYSKSSAKILEAVREFNPTVHFLAVEHGDGFDAARGQKEVEDCLRAVCVQKYSPEALPDYVSCRGKNINSSRWGRCLPRDEAVKIKKCAADGEGVSLLRENIKLNRELKVMFGPVYLLDNQEIFGSKGIPAKEELKKIIKR